MARNMRRKSGQSLIEFAIATPMLIGLLLGAFNVGVLASKVKTLVDGLGLLTPRTVLAHGARAT